MRLIDADALKEIIKEEFDGCCVYDVDESEVIYDFNDIVDRTPTVDTVKHGYWINAGHDEWSHYRKCSVCGKLIVNMSKTNYCPDCGAKMDEVQDGKEEET